MASPTSEWLQVNVALVRRNGSALPAARAILRAIAELPNRNRPRFFFQRKPPDLRLRFFGNRERLRDRLRPLLRRAKSDGHLVSQFSSVYEPEYRQFGGRECMKAVHAFWHADSLLWIERDRLAERGMRDEQHGRLIEAVLGDLFWRVLQDPGETWDAWCNFAVLVRATGAATAAPLPPAPALESWTAQDADIVAAYRQANAELAAGLSRAWHAGRMSCGIRSILPYVALFTLNRHGYDHVRLATLALQMTGAWNPKSQLRGAAPDRPTSRARDPGRPHSPAVENDG